MTSIHIVTLCLLLLALTCAASLLQRAVKLPLPFLQIFVGACVAMPPLGLDIALDPDTFLLLFLPLLLFGDGWRLPRRGLSSQRWSVLGYAVGLAFLTTIVGGYALHALVPAMPLSVAFVVAASAAPTDAVALAAITRNLPVPHELKHLIESEALLNDASGLVAMRIAIAATLSGQFAVSQAVGSFMWVAALGLLIGIALSLLYHQIHRRLLVGANDAIVQTVLLGLLPFAAFAIAEEANASGILAAVAAGITASRLSLIEQAHYSARIMTGITWDVTSFCLNGIIFVLLGMQLPGIIGGGPEGIDLFTSGETRAIALDVLILSAVLIGLRALWVIAPLAIRRMFGHPANGGGWRVILASSLAGVRGAVTLAGALSIPLHLPSGAPFPYRDLAITIAVGIIIVSILVAAIALPLLLRGIDDHHRGKSAEEVMRARRETALAAIAVLSNSGGEASAHETALSASYRSRLSEIDRGELDAGDDAWRRAHQSAIHAERRAVQALRHQDEIDDITARQLLLELDFVEASLMQRPTRCS